MGFDESLSICCNHFHIKTLNLLKYILLVLIYFIINGTLAISADPEWVHCPIQAKLSPNYFSVNSLE